MVKRHYIAMLLAVSLLAAATGPVRAEYTNLHSFGVSPGDGAYPWGSLTLSGTTLYGMAQGGTSSNGVVFKVETDGSGYTILHQFTGGASDGAQPTGDLTLSGTTLYGMTLHGGAFDKGVVFQISTNGTGFGVLHSFAGDPSDGAQPFGSLTVSGTTLYGMTSEGGTFTNGVVFQMNVSGSGYTILHEFAGGPGEGYDPYGALSVSGTTLYGMTLYGGATDNGVVFRMNADGSGYTNLHEFARGCGDGGYPFGSLTLSGTTLYGVTLWGGRYNTGVVFQLDVDGARYANVHEFAGGPGDGGLPYRSSVTVSGTTLYGTTLRGGASSNGVVFALVAAALPTITTTNPLPSGTVGTG